MNILSSLLVPNLHDMLSYEVIYSTRFSVNNDLVISLFLIQYKPTTWLRKTWYIMHNSYRLLYDAFMVLFGA